MLLPLSSIVWHNYRVRLLLFFLLNVCYTVCHDTVSLTIYGNSLQVDCASQLHQAVPSAQVLESIEFESDVYMSNQEFDYLAELHVGDLISYQEIQKALIFLQKKHIFESLTLHISRRESGITLKIVGKGLWSFRALKMHGVLTAKERYRRYYMIEAGEPFSEEKHAQSLRAITSALRKDGYHTARLKTWLVRNNTTKSITVHCSIDHGKKFGIRDVILDLRNHTALPLAMTDTMSSSIEKKFLKPLVKRSYSHDAIVKKAGALRFFLMEQGFFRSTIRIEEVIDVEHHAVTLRFLIDLGVKREFIFIGNRFFTVQQLLQALTLFGRSAALLPVSALKDELVYLYTGKGFFTIDIQVKDEGDKIFFIIQEGSQSKLGSLIFEGCAAYTPEFLSNMHCKELLHHTVIDRVNVEKALDAIVRFYVDEGFLDARIASYEYRPTEGSKTHNLIVTIDEGVRYVIKNVSVHGTTDIPGGGPLAECNRSAAQPFTVQSLRNQRVWLTDKLLKIDRGIISLRPHIEKFDGAVSIVWHTDSEKPITFGKTVITGSTILPFDYIMRELDYKQGDPWDQDRLKKTVKKLRALDLFDTIYVYPDNSDKTSETKTILAKIQMDDPFEMRMRGGLGLQQVSHEFKFLGFTYRAGGTFIVKNPFNLADQFSCALDFAKYDSSAVALYRKPWFLGTPINASFQLYHSRQSHPGIVKSSENLYQVMQQGGMMTFTGEHPYGTFGINMGVESMETTTANAAGQDWQVADALARAIQFAPELLNKKVPYFLLEPTFLIDRLDNTLNPKFGTFTLISCKGMFPLARTGGRSFFVRCSLEQSCFFSIRHITLAFRVRLGHIFHDLFKTIMPSERFYLGGAHSIRSYDMDFAPPLGIFKDEHDVEHCVPRGGKSMVNGNFEVRMPVYDKIGFVLFQDLGALSGSGLAVVMPDAILTATGCGLRYDTVFGPIRFDIGIKPSTKRLCDMRYAWFLTLGQAF